jgi:hypothetical protein
MIENTTMREPIVHEAGIAAEGREGYISGMARAGGAELRDQANSGQDWVQVPRNIHSPGADFEALGFEFHRADRAIVDRAEAIDVRADGTDGYSERKDERDRILAELSDPLFVRAKLPEGWKVEDGKDDYGFWNYAVDPDGYRRVSIFYKAAFLDRKAHMGIVRLPQTAAQADVWQKVAPADECWTSGESRRQGANYVYVFNGRYGDSAPEGKRADSDDGRRLEVEVAPDGTVVDRRGYTTEPEDDRW